MKKGFNGKKFEHALAMELCRREGKKIELNIAQMKEVVRCLVELIAFNSITLTCLHKAAILRGFYGLLKPEGTEGSKTKTVRNMRRSGDGKPSLRRKKLPAKPSIRKGSVSSVRSGKKGRVK